ncbi:ATP-binding protein [Haloplanus halobius]|uniref:ATP-binding protein n=1 Tax=Haloplanus halobius TaxID=2934938 RepID=UPI00200D27D3|nr:ATP-binding protein [Haloplanus sp. XH21]
MSDPSVPLAGTTLVVGPSNAGKTRLTAEALQSWVEHEGTAGVAILEFAPELERDGRILGGRLDRFLTPPADAWQGVLDAHAPRTTADSPSEAVELAADNARRADTLFDAAPDAPRAVFVNDATIPFQHADADPTHLLDYCADAEMAVLNALEADEIVGDDAVSRAERRTLDAFRSAADRVIRLDDG